MVDINKEQSIKGHLKGLSGEHVDLEHAILSQRVQEPVELATEFEFLTGPEPDYALKGVNKKTGRIYASKEQYIKHSDDLGVTWQHTLKMHPTGLSNVTNMVVLDNGDVLICGREIDSESRIWKMDADGKNYRKVLSYEAGQGHIYGEFGFTSYQNIVLAGTYGSGPWLKEVVVYLSLDYGETWEKIFSKPNITVDPVNGHHHIHDVRYDPYENLIWVCGGDDDLDPHTHSFVYWSANMGKTWTKGLGFRATQVIPLPNAVVFGSDQTEVAGAVRYDRNFQGVAGVNLKWDGKKNEYLDWIAQRFPGQNLAPQWATIAGIEYGKNARAYFGFRTTPQNGANIMSPTVWGTRDGLRYTAIWTLGRRSQTGEGGVLGVHGPDKDNNLYVSLHNDLGNGQMHQMLRIKLED